MVLCLREPPRSFLLLLYLHFIFVLHFIFDLYFVVVLQLFAFRHHPSPFRGLPPGFYTHFILSAQPIAKWFTTLSFSTFPGSSYRKRYGFEWAFFTHRYFLRYASSPTFLTQHAFIKASLGAGNSSLKFSGLYTDPRNTDMAHLFVWITVIHNLHIQKDWFLYSTIYYHELLVVRSLVYILLACFKLFSLVQSHM